MKSYSKKWLSVCLCVVIISSSLAIVGSAGKQDDIPPNEGEGLPDLQVTELRADSPVIYLDKDNRLVLSIENFGNDIALKVTANVTDIIPSLEQEDYYGH